MKSELIAQICTVLSTMKADQPWTAKHEEVYFLGLHDVSDQVGAQLVRQILQEWDWRPSVKEIRDLASALVAPPVFDINRLSAPVAGIDRQLPAPPAAPAPVGRQQARRIMDELRKRAARLGGEDEQGPLCGLQFRNLSTGAVQRTNPYMSRRAAEAKAADRNKRWPHQETTVFTKGDPWPAGVPQPAAEEASEMVQAAA